jgi:hypothetical protein
VIGSELVTGGYSDLSIFTDTSGSVTYDAASGGVRLEEVAGVDAIAKIGSTTDGITVTAGSVYLVSFEILAGTDSVLFSADRDSSGGDVITATAASGLGVKEYTFVAPTTNINFLWASTGGDNGNVTIGNISVKEINPLAVSIQMDGRMTYVDTSSLPEVELIRWLLDGSNNIRTYLTTSSALTGRLDFVQENANVTDGVSTSDTYYSPGVFVPFNIASRHGSTFINGAVDGVALTADTTPTALPDLSTTDLNLGYDFMGTIQNFQIWDRDIGDQGLVDETAPSLEPSLFLTFDGTTGSYTVTDWSE